MLKSICYLPIFGIKKEAQRHETIQIHRRQSQRLRPKNKGTPGGRILEVAYYEYQRNEKRQRADTKAVGRADRRKYQVGAEIRGRGH